MTNEEVSKLKEIVRIRYAQSEREGCRWDDVLVGINIERMSKLMHLVVPSTENEVRIEDPEGRFLKMSLETAKKMLVLGIP